MTPTRPIKKNMNFTIYDLIITVLIELNPSPKRLYLKVADTFSFNVYTLLK